MLLFTLLTLFGLIPKAAPPPCTVAPCVFSTNVTWDSAGKAAAPPAWGTQDSWTWTYVFQQVPVGYRVKVLRIDGDETFGYHGAPKPGSNAYVSVGMTTSTPGASPYVNFGGTKPPLAAGAQGCFMYYQAAIGSGRIPISLDTSSGGMLNADNEMRLVEAQFLNDSGVSIHIETTGIFQFVFVPAPVSVAVTSAKATARTSPR